jgi:geranylgeranyl reductase family protein
VLVVGGGPGGAAAATTAARSGLDVVVVDKASFPRDKCCGDGLTAGALRWLEHLGLDPGLVPSWQPVDQVRLVAPSGRAVVFPLPEGPGHHAAVARRRELDAALLRGAAGAGAEVRQGVEVSAVDASAPDRVRVRVGDATVEARYLVAADGMWSTVRRALGLAPAGYRGEWHAFRQYFAGAPPEARRQLLVWFEADLLPGYAWSFPLADGTVNVGFGIQRGGRPAGRELSQRWRELLSRPAVHRLLGPDLVPEEAARAWPIPARLGRDATTAGRVLFVGDAAGATDPMTGEGIGQALETGVLAARAVAAAGPGTPERATDAYRATLAKGMARDHQLARRLSAVLASPGRAEVALRTAGMTPWTRRHFARWLFEDYPRAVIGTPHRWHRGVFQGPGAFAPAVAVAPPS